MKILLSPFVLFFIYLFSKNQEIYFAKEWPVYKQKLEKRCKIQYIDLQHYHKI